MPTQTRFPGGMPASGPSVQTQADSWGGGCVVPREPSSHLFSQVGTLSTRDSAPGHQLSSQGKAFRTRDSPPGYLWERWLMEGTPGAVNGLTSHVACKVEEPCGLQSGGGSTLEGAHVVVRWVCQEPGASR